jgi:DNA-binding CsgD family transcriptional regulator
VRLPVSHREAVRDVEAICRLDVGSRELRTRIVTRLTRLIPADSFCFGTIDPTTLLVTDDVSEGLTPDAAAAAAHNEYLVDDVLKFADLALSRPAAGVLSAATGGDPARSHRYRVVLPTIDAEHELRAAFVVDGQCWGGIAMFRSGRHPDFTATDAATLRQLSPMAGAALRRAAHHSPGHVETVPAEAGATLPAGAGSTLPAEAGVLVLDADWKLLTANPAADRWLDEVSARRTDVSADRSSGLPIGVLEVAARGRVARVPAWGRVRGRSGRWLSLRASPLGEHDIAVTIHPAPVAEVIEVLLLAYGLTPRERDILEHVIAGRPYRTIATRLGITQVTVQDHLKSIFAKTGVRSRGELVARMLDLSRAGVG